MHLARRLPAFNKLSTNCRHITCNNKINYTKAAGSTNETIKDFELPNRIQRTPTDLLQALASTVKRDPTAAHYKYHDDPYLLPTTNISKKSFALAQEAGRKAAKWIKEEHRDIFFHQEAQPSIEKFAPKMIFNEESDVDEKSLKQLIEQFEINDAVLVYNLMKQKNIEISDELRQSLLELICFYNNEEPLPDEYSEERTFKQANIARERYKKTWKDGTLAEQIYAEIEPKTPQAYATLIRGMSKFYQAERAFALFQEAEEKQIQLDTNTYNSIINITYFLKETADQRWTLCTELLQKMKEQQLKPNLGTLNALMEVISTITNTKFSRSCALKVLSEFKKLGIEPSLGTYYYILITFCRDRSPVSHVIVDILLELKDKELKIQHPKDTYFFATAMDICRNHLHDKSLAYKLDALLHTGNNYDLIGDSYKESVYYRNFIALLCQTEIMEDFMQKYDIFVPNVYIPEPGIMEEIFKAVELNAAIEYIPRLWSDIIVFDLLGRESLLQRVIKIMINNQPNVDKLLQQQLPQQFAKIALDIYNTIEDNDNNKNNQRTRKLSFTGQMIGDILTLLVRGDNYEKAIEVFNNIDKNQHKIPGTPTEENLMEFIECCIINKAPTQAITCLQYCVENNMECLIMAKRINAGFTLNEIHISKMKSLVGDGFLK